MNDIPALRLPSFVDRDSLQNHLKWAPSIKRAYREAAARAGLGESAAAGSVDVYADIAALVARPGGMALFERLVQQADPSKKRGLLAVVQKTVTMKTKSFSTGDEFYDQMREMLDARQFEEVAWIVFHRLAFTIPFPMELAEPDLLDMFALIQRNPELEDLLGHYWVDWQALSDRVDVDLDADGKREEYDDENSEVGSKADAGFKPNAGADEEVEDEPAPTGPDDVAPASRETPGIEAPRGETSDLTAAWSREIEDLEAALSTAPFFDTSLSERMLAAAETFRTLALRHAEQAVNAAEQERAAARELFSASLARLLETWDAPVALPAALSEAGAAATRVAMLEHATAWASTSTSAITASTRRCEAAAVRRREEDSDAADDEDVAANRERRALRVRIEAEAVHWTSNLLQAGGKADGAHAEDLPGHIAADATDPEDVAISEEMPSDGAGRATLEATPIAILTETGVDDPTPVVPALQEQVVDDDEAAEIVSIAHEEESRFSAPTEPTEMQPQNPEVLSEPFPDQEDPTAGWNATPLEAEPAVYGGKLDALETSELLAVFLPRVAQAPSDEAETLLEASRRALMEGHYGFAAHLSRAAQALGASGIAGDGPVLEALAVGVAVSERRVAQAASAYARIESELYAIDEPASLGQSTRLLLMAGALRPAIFSSQTGAAEVFRMAEPGSFGSALHDLAEFLADLPRRGGHLDFADVAPAADEQFRRRVAETAREDLLRAVDNAGDRRAVFQRAMSILTGVLGAGVVGDAIALIRRSSPNATEKAEEAAGWLDGDLDRRVEQLDDEARRPRRGAALEGMARRWLVQRLGEVASLLRRWAAAERAAHGIHSGHVGEMRSQLRQLVGAAVETVFAIDGGKEAALGKAVLSNVISDLVRVLDGEAPADSNLDLAMLLHDELLLVIPYPDLGPDRAWTASAAIDLAEGARIVLDGAADYEGAFRRLMQRGRFAEAEAAIDRIAAEGGERSAMDDLVREERRRRKDALTQESVLLRRKLDDVLGADTAGRVDLSLQIRADAIAALLAGDAAFLDFPALQAGLRSLEEEVGDIGELLLAPLRAEIDSLELTDAVAATLRRMADKGDLTTLREHVEAVKTGADLGTSTGERLRNFAKTFLTPAFEKLGAPSRNTATLIDLASARKSNESVDFSHLGDEDVAGATELLKAWRSLKGAKANTQAFTPALRDLFTALRFTSVKITGETPLHPAQRLNLSCDRIGDRRDCPVPAFGSAAKGSYAVIVIDTVAVKNGVELFNLVKRLESPTTKPTIIVVVGAPLPTSRRREYMVEARKRGALEPCALIDEAAILFLAARPGRGLSDLFAIALPMGAVQPYSDANGQTSPEMFFGRDVELTQLWDRYGSCLVYGGRQLGKTALLEQLRLRHHRPPAQVVIGGSIQGFTDIWPWLLKNLREANVPVKGTHANAICDSIREWLVRDDSRRILILVDEADIYLQAQMSGDYASLIKVRELMQDTERRCKFVFAGLHNVQRLARQPNSPLLHFGTPLRVGPLYGTDLGEARAMIERPMAAAGFVYSADTLPGRVLSELGYYPSLLQTFGKTMIDRLNRMASARMPQSSPLPIMISESDIDDVLTDPHFRGNLSGKFEATLSLDERYRLITYAMLVHSMDRRGSSPALQDVEVQERALNWWPQGFAQDSTLDAFQGLLQEMVGLGVLIETEGRYAIRSSRIAAMLGGRDEIERKLLEMSVMPGYQKLDTGSFRRLEKDSFVPSPMTARQEGVTLAARDAPPVQLVLGSKALGVDELAASLEVLADDELAVERASYENVTQLLARLEPARQRRTLLVLTGPWPGRDGVAELLRSEQVRKSRRGGRRSLQVMLAPHTVDWRDLGEIDETGRLWGVDLLTLTPLGDTGLRQWLRAVTGSEPAEAIGELRELTGGFPALLRGLGGKNPADLLERARDAAARRAGNADTFSALGLADTELRRTTEVIAFLGGHSGKATEELLAGEGINNPRGAAAQLERLGILEIGIEPGGDRVLNPLVGKLLAVPEE